MKAGDTLTFHYPNFGEPNAFPDYTAHSGQTVTIIRQEHLEDPEEYGEALFTVKATDGWEGAAWESELGEAGFTPHDPEHCGCKA